MFLINDLINASFKKYLPSVVATGLLRRFLSPMKNEAKISSEYFFSSKQGRYNQLILSSAMQKWRPQTSKIPVLLYSLCFPSAYMTFTSPRLTPIHQYFFLAFLFYSKMTFVPPALFAKVPYWLWALIALHTTSFFINYFRFMGNVFFVCTVLV